MIFEAAKEKKKATMKVNPIDEKWSHERERGNKKKKRFTHTCIIKVLCKKSKK